MTLPRHTAIALALASALLAPAQAARAAGSPLPPPATAPEHPAPIPLFQPGAVTPFRLHLDPQALDQLRRAPRTWVRVRVQAPGFETDDACLHLKGRTGSFRPIDDAKPAFTLDFDPAARGRHFHGLTRIHLNNAVEDPTLLHEKLAATVFATAGIPTPRTAHARVELNGRPLGLYVLKEGFSSAFLHDQGLDPDSLVAEADPSGDVDAPQTLKSPRHLRGQPFSAAPLLAAAREPDLSRRWQQLEAVLDTDRFATFLALEILLGHRDGYGLAANNYRLHQDPTTTRFQFLPHGLDQLFGNPELPWKPAFAGEIARAFLACPEGLQAYEDHFRTLHERWLVHDALAAELERTLAALRPNLTPGEYRTLRRQAADLNARVADRTRHLTAQLAPSPTPPLAWVDNSASLSGWIPSDHRGVRETPVALDSPNHLAPLLRLATDGPTSASWRTRLRLDAGHYRFLGRVRVEDVVPLPFGRAHGAGLRIGGQTRPPSGLVGTRDWTPLATDFVVMADGTEVELICELRARAGRAWFDESSLRLVRSIAPVAAVASVPSPPPSSPRPASAPSSPVAARLTATSLAPLP